MARDIRRITTEQEFKEFAVPYLNAYPGSQAQPDTVAKQYFEVSHDPANHFWSVYEDGQLVGGMRLLDFEMNYYGKFIKAGGVGSVWVDYLHKKQGIAKDLITFFLDYYERAGAHMALLYPFRPDFYHKMGFGYGTKQEHYSFAPASLPKYDGAHGIVYLTEDDAQFLQDLRNRVAAARHGHIKMHTAERIGTFMNFPPRKTIVGYKENGVLRGYMTYGFKRYDSSFVKNDMMIRDWVCDGPETLLRFCGFLRSQADQIHRIQFNTQDEGFHFLLDDVRDGSDNLIPSVYHQSNTAGVGLMYRIINLREFLKATATSRCMNYQTLDLVLHVEDSFRPGNAGTHYIRFRDGIASLSDTPLKGIELTIDIAELSSLFMGSVTINALYRYGRAKMSAADLPSLTKLFAAEKPTCLTVF
ncbi:MAG: enhanced intracellular survival protein Eis [Chloroflexota bacterium]